MVKLLTSKVLVLLIIKINWFLLLINNKVATLPIEYNSVCSSMEINIDFKGEYDVAFTYDTKTVEECSDLCSEIGLTNCTGFTFWQMTTNLNVCFLKNFQTTPKRYPSFGRISCIMVRVASLITATTSISTTLTSTPILTSFSLYSSSTTRKITTSTKSELKCSEENGFFFGESFTYVVYYVTYVSQCCDLCLQNRKENCIAFSYLTDESICFIYEKNDGFGGDRVTRPNTISGVITYYN